MAGSVPESTLDEKEWHLNSFCSFACPKGTCLTHPGNAGTLPAPCLWYYVNPKPAVENR